SLLTRRLTGKGQAQHRLQRAGRLCANERVGASGARHGIVRRLLQRRQPKPLAVALDWTAIRNFHTLMAAAVLKGPAVPLLGATFPTGKLAPSQNNLEDGLRRLLRALIPNSVRGLVLADRGFGRTELARTCQQLGFRYAVRLKSKRNGFALRHTQLTKPARIDRLLL